MPSIETCLRVPAPRALGGPLRQLLAGVALGLAFVPAGARAHEFWLSPSTYRATQGDTIAVRAFVGTGFRGEAKPYAVPRVVRFTMRSAASRDLARVGLNGDLVFARFVLPDAGGTLVAYQSNDAFLELAAERYNAYLKMEGLDAALVERKRQGAEADAGREHYSRCAKTWIAPAASTGQAGSHTGNRLVEPVGLPYEIVPLGDPVSDKKLRVRLVYQGKPLAGALLRAWNRSLERYAVPTDAASRDSVPSTFEGRSNGDGVVIVPVDRPGEWLLNSVHMQEAPPRSGADWESIWASLSFARAAASPSVAEKRRARRP